MYIIDKDGEVGASLPLREKPVSSEEIMFKEDCVEVNDVVIDKDGEVGLLRHLNELYIVCQYFYL